jgi:hypothetical protein
MPEGLWQIVALVLGSLVGGGGLVGVWLQSRATRAVAGKAADVEAGKSAGQLALDVAVHVSSRLDVQNKRIDELESENKERARELAGVRGELRSVLEEVEAIARDLRHMVLWDENGRRGDPPVRLTDIHARLEALSNRRVDP